MVGDLFAVTFTWQSKDGIAQNVRHYQITTQTGDDPAPRDVAFAADLEVVNDYLPIVSSQAHYVTTRAQRISITTGLPLSAFGEGTVFGNLAGGVAGDKLPGQVAGIITLRTNQPGPRRRGRFYCSFPAEASSDVTGVPVEPYIAAAATLGGRLLTSLSVVAGGGPATLSPVIYSRAGAITTQLLAIQVRSVWGTQRRRRRGVGA